VAADFPYSEPPRVGGTQCQYPAHHADNCSFRVLSRVARTAERGQGAAVFPPLSASRAGGTRRAGFRHDVLQSERTIGPASPGRTAAVPNCFSRANVTRGTACATVFSAHRFARACPLL